MIFDPESVPHLKPWLVRTLEPICDAEPGALSDYILALLKHNVPETEMRKELQVQLEEFLENECKSFIDTLFTVLRTKSYLPYSTNPPSPPPSGSQDEGIPIPLDEIMGAAAAAAAGPSSDRTRKRNSEDDEREGRPKKGPRLDGDQDFSRYAGAAANWGGQQQQQQQAMGMGMGGFPMGMPGMDFSMMNNGQASAGRANGRRNQQQYQPPGQKRGICREYHHQGFCARGDSCKYSHGEDAVIPSQLYPMVNPQMMPFNMLYNMFNPGAAPYDPNDARLDIGGGAGARQRAPLLQQGMPQTSGELPVIQDLTPSGVKPDSSSSPKLPTTAQAVGESNAMAPQGMQPMQQGGLPMGFDPAMFGMPPFTIPNVDPNAMSTGPEGVPPQGRENPHFRGRGGGGHHRGRGGQMNGGGGGGGSEVSSFRPPRRGVDKTLVVEKIPDDKLSLDAITAWFKKFGNVTNVAVDNYGKKALVSFETHDEARTAWKSEDAVFNNRFVKVFWHKPMEGRGLIGQQALKASAVLVEGLAKEGSAAPVPGASSVAATPKTTTSTAPLKKTGGSQSAAALALAAKQQLLEKQIAEQKGLMDELSSAIPERKKEIMARLRKLGEEMTAAKSAEKAPEPDSHEMQGVEGPSNAGGEDKETTEQLKAKLAKLKAEAASLGISESDPSSFPAGGYRGGYRGRGRGRGAPAWRGGPAVMRGGPPRGSLKLDNRPKKLLVKGVMDEHTQHVKDWYESVGQVENIETLSSGDVLVSFKSRAAAEQGLAMGTNIPRVGKVQIAWHATTTAAATAKPPGSVSAGATPTATTTTATAAATANEGAAAPQTSAMAVDKTASQDGAPMRAASPPRDDREEDEGAAWGAEDDGMGML